MNSSSELADPTAASHPSHDDGDFLVVVIVFLVGIVVVLSLGLLVLSTTGQWLVPG
jgi:uncharacterized membrane protein